MNLYTYCHNNPIIGVDPSGHKKGDKFETIDEAAKDFAINYNPKSIEEKIEYATTIYKVKEKVTTAHYFNLSELLGIKKETNPILYNFFSSVKTTSTKEVTMYTYTDINKGDIDSVVPPFAPLFKRKSAVAHTHGAYNPKYLGEQFSEADLDYSINHGIPIYVATPSGTLRKYDPNNYVFGEDNSKILYYDIPYDPNHPNHAK